MSVHNPPTDGSKIVKIPYQTQYSLSTTVRDFCTSISLFVQETSCYSSEFFNESFQFSPK